MKDESTRVKICGLTNLADARTAAEAGADMLGYIFYAASRRCADPDVVRGITCDLRRAYPGLRMVGVFVDENVETVRALASRCGLDTVQLHGDEPVAAVEALVACGLAVIKAFRVGAAHAMAPFAPYIRAGADALLLDTYVKGKAGGTGETFDWAFAREVGALGRVIVAGGLSAANIGEAIRVAQPWGVDVAGGVERTAGLKDAEQIHRFIAVVREAGKESEESTDDSD